MRVIVFFVSLGFLIVFFILAMINESKEEKYPFVIEKFITEPASYKVRAHYYVYGYSPKYRKYATINIGLESYVYYQDKGIKNIEIKDSERDISRTFGTEFENFFWTLFFTALALWILSLLSCIIKYL